MNFDNRIRLCSQHPTWDVGHVHHPRESLYFSCLLIPIPSYSTTTLISFTMDAFGLFLNLIQTESFSRYFFVSASFCLTILFEIHPAVACISSLFKKKNLTSSPLCVCLYYSLFIYLFMDIWVVSTFWLLWRKQL